MITLFDYYLLLIIINIFQYTDYGIALFSLDNGKTKFFDLVQMIDFYQLNQVMPRAELGTRQHCHATTRQHCRYKLLIIAFCLYILCDYSI